jgi:hypothetical protein
VILGFSSISNFSRYYRSAKNWFLLFSSLQYEFA